MLLIIVYPNNNTLQKLSSKIQVMTFPFILNYFVMKFESMTYFVTYRHGLFQGEQI